MDPALNLRSAQTTYLSKVCAWMMAGLGITAVVALIVEMTGGAHELFGDRPFFLIGLILVELGLVVWLSARYQRMSAGKAAAIFFAYAALNGLTLSVIFEVYTSATVAAALFITTGMFGALGLFGWVTKRDLSKMGTFLFMALIGLLITMIVGIFIQATALQWVICIGGVLIFSGLTMYDFQRIKEEGSFAQGESTAIVSALGLYLNFINLLLFVLQFLGLAGGRD